MNNYPTISVINFKPDWNDLDANLMNAVSIVKEAAAKGTNIIVFPELALSGPVNGNNEGELILNQDRVLNEMRQVAKNNNIWIVFGIAEKDECWHNSIFMVDPDDSTDVYRAVHISNDDRKWATPGDSFKIFNTLWGPIGIGTGYEVANFFEITRYARAKGANLFINCAWFRNVSSDFDGKIIRISPGFIRKMLEYTTITTSLYVATSAVIGESGYGHSSIIGPGDAAGSIYYCNGEPFDANDDHKDPVIVSVSADFSKCNREKSNLFYNTNPKTGIPDWRPEVYKEMYEEQITAVTDSKGLYKDILNLAIVNFHAEWGRKEKNLERMLEYIESASRLGSNLIVFPELALTGYDDDRGKSFNEKMHVTEAESIPGPSSKRISEYAQKYNMFVFFGLPERSQEKTNTIYNSVAICKPDGTIDSCQKVHLADDEPYWASLGATPYITESEWGPIGVAVCYDNYSFPEMARHAKAKGARLFINCTANAESFRREVARAELEGNVAVNRMFVASSNLCGWDRDHYFYGNSSILGPLTKENGISYYAGTPFTSDKGEIPKLIVTTIDLSLADDDQGDFQTDISNEMRPEVYLGAMRDILSDPLWRSKIKSDLK